MVFRIWDKQEEKWIHGSDPDDINDLFDMNYYTDKSNPDLFLDLESSAGKRYEIVLPDIDAVDGKHTFVEPS